MEKNYKYVFITEEDRRFNSFLDKTIVGTSWNFFNKLKEEKNIKEYKEDIVIECSSEKGLFEETSDISLSIALESLTENERLVISFSFENELKGEQIAKKMGIKANSFYRKRTKILNKLKKIILEERENGDS
ncbi:MAG: sigma factor-like helix-turn-helix DNA-binding protein [Clostridia bacterium]|nr:sigma factor-like helix-turn-helix DNA-binding protein [Clostridia bacterium]